MRTRHCDAEAIVLPPVQFSVSIENSPTEAARLLAEPVSVFHALGSIFDPLAATGLEPVTPGL